MGEFSIQDQVKRGLLNLNLNHDTEAEFLNQFIGYACKIQKFHCGQRLAC